MHRLSPLFVILVLSSTLSWAQQDWFPPQYAEQAARALAERMVEIGVEMEANDEQRLATTREFVQSLVARIDRWGLEGLLERTPPLPEIDLPVFDDPIVASIARIGACSLPLHPELAGTNEELLYVATGEISVVVVSALLRQRFLDAGGTDEQLALQLNSERMNQLSYDIQVKEEQRNYVAAACAPMFSALFEG